MADRRKLQVEIERCFKKVSEGVEAFEDIWKKTQNTANNNQKEKYEADLKREIKKLQRLRDQIKTWQTSSDIKDKKVLLENRKLIETQMERFKVVERETKTKAYSKEGLGAAAKLDPATKEKGEILSWLSQNIDDLTYQKDQFESELENMAAGNKKKKDKECQDKTEELQKLKERHTYHINQLETIMRLLDNDALSIEQIKNIKDDIEYYVINNQDTDFSENEFMYDELDLDDLSDLNAPSSTTAATQPGENDDMDKTSTTPNSVNSSSPSPSPNLLLNHTKSSSGSIDKLKLGTSSISTYSSGLSSTSSKAPTPVKVSNNPSLSSATLNNHPNATFGAPYATAVGHHNDLYSGGFSDMRGSTDLTPVSESSVMNIWSNLADITGSAVTSLSHTSNESRHFASIHTDDLNSNVSLSTTGDMNFDQSPSLLSTLDQSRLNPSVMSNGPSTAGGAMEVLKDETSDLLSSMSLKSMAQQAVVSLAVSHTPSTSDSQQVHNDHIFNNLTMSSKPPVPSIPSPGDLAPLLQTQSLSQTSLPSNILLQQQLTNPPSQPQTTTTIHLNPLLGVAPLGPVRLSKEQLNQSLMIESMFYHLPHPSDSERLRHYLPRNPYSSPAYYPQNPPASADCIEFFQRLSPESLFFIFYYMEGTKAQYLAAKSLKRLSWRFHTRYMMWFQRHDEPKTITDDFEQGTYIYFDYEKWGQRKKDGFTFEYRYLEDRELS